MSLVPHKRKKIAKPLDTREKIIKISIELFNEKGIQNVSIRDIASKSNISIGNLTYYFKKKNDLIHATLEVLSERLSVALARPTELASLEFGVDYLIRIYTTFWEYRFYFNALNYLIVRDRQLREDYYEFRDWLIDTVASDLEYMCKNGYWNEPTSPNSFRLQAENIWRLWLSWLRMYQLDHFTSKINPKEALYDCALHHWGLCQGWLKPKYSRELLDKFQSILLDPDKQKEK